MIKLKQKGQSSIEFIMSFVVVLGLFFMFLSTGLNFVAGYLTHYAVYHSSRVFLSFDQGKNPEDVFSLAQRRATEAFKSVHLENFGVEGDIKFNIPGSGSIPEFYGAYFQYKRPLSIYRMITGEKVINYMSESYLGKEPTREECRRQICQAMGMSCDQGTPSGDFDVTLFDNGC